MSRYFVLPLVAASLLAGQACAAKITATAQEGEVAVFTTTKKYEVCSVRVNFTFLKDGKREDGMTSKAQFGVEPGKRMLAWKFTNPGIVAPLLKDGYIADCRDATPDETGKIKGAFAKQH